MAARTNLSDRIDHQLHLSHLMVDELDEFTAVHDELSTDEWLSWTQDWGNLVVIGMRTLNTHADNDDMTSAQMAAYRRLLQRITERQATIEAYHLGMPHIPAQIT